MAWRAVEGRAIGGYYLWDINITSPPSSRLIRTVRYQEFGPSLTDVEGLAYGQGRWIIMVSSSRFSQTFWDITSNTDPPTFLGSIPKSLSGSGFGGLAFGRVNDEDVWIASIGEDLYRLNLSDIPNSTKIGTLSNYRGLAYGQVNGVNTWLAVTGGSLYGLNLESDPIEETLIGHFLSDVGSQTGIANAGCLAYGDGNWYTADFEGSGAEWWRIDTTTPANSTFIGILGPRNNRLTQPKGLANDLGLPPRPPVDLSLGFGSGNPTLSIEGIGGVDICPLPPLGFESGNPFWEIEIDSFDSQWSPYPHSGPTPRTLIGDLEPNARYQIRTRKTLDGKEPSKWSDTLEAETTE